MHLLFRSDRRRWPLLLNCRLVIFGLVFCCLLITGAWGQELKRLPVVPDFDFDRLIASYPGFAEIASIAREHKVTFGIYGGTVRDLYLGRRFSTISDFDTIYDSSEPGFPAFRNRVLERARSLKAGIPSPDFHFDLSSLSRPSERQRQYHEEGITATKVGVFCDGTMIDPTGYGVKDLRQRMFRFVPSDKSFIELQNVGRFIRDYVRLPGFRADSATIELMRRSLDRCRKSDTPEGQQTRAAVASCRALPRENDWLTFPALINVFRQDLRWLHNGRSERLSTCYPVNLFLVELFRTVTQADDVKSMQSGFARFDLASFLMAIGLEQEGKLLTDPTLSRDALFDAFQFPGHWPEVPRSISFLEKWTRTVTRYNYRVLFDMMKSEFPADSFEAKVLTWRRDGFLSPGSYRMMNPGTNWREMIESLLDADFNLGTLPREKTMAGLDWFLKVYLPHGETVLKPVSVGQISRSALREIRVGFSPEIRLVSRREPHSMKDVDAYLEYLLGPELVPLYRDPRTSCAFFMASPEESAALLRHLGYTKVYRLNACGYSRRHRTLIGYNERLDRVCITQCAFHSDDQLLNHQARLYFLRRHLAGDGPGSVFVLRRPDQAFPAEDEFRLFLSNLRSPVDTLFIGFSNPLKKLLAEVQSVQIGDLDLKIGLMPDCQGCPRRLAVAMSAFGANYGSLPARLAEILLEQDLKRVVLVGTGGGISRKAQRFGWVAPSSVALREYGRSGDWMPFENLASRLDLKHLLTAGRHVSVLSPLAETQAEVRDLRREAVLSVDCELAHLVKCLRDRRAAIEIYALINITDFPLGADQEDADGAIAVENAQEQYQAVEEALKAIAVDITLRSSTPD